MQRNNNRKNKPGLILRMKDIGDRLRFLRGESSQQEFGELVGIPQRKLSRIETGRAPIDLDSTQKICKATGISTDWLLTGHGPMRPGDKESTSPAPQKGAAETCRRCLDLYEKLDKANDRLYETMRENSELKEAIGRLEKELDALKNEQSERDNALPVANAS